MVSAIWAAPAPNGPNARIAIDTALRSAVGKPVDIDLTAEDRQKIERLGLAGKEVSDLTPLAKLPNLRHLWVHNNRINDLSPAAQLRNLESLYLDHNQITDLTPLGQCGKLRVLSLNNNRPCLLYTSDAADE